MERSLEWCQGVMPSFDLNCMAGLLQSFRFCRTNLLHADFRTDICSLGESSFFIVLPVGQQVSAEASLSACSLPAIPEWLGIQ